MAVKRTKLINTSRVTHEIWTNRETSRVDIARSLGLDKSTVSAIVNELLDAGVIRETREGEAGPQGGRKPVHISLNGSYGCVLGIELRPESYTAVGVNLNGEVVFSRFEKIDTAGPIVRERILEIIDRVEDERRHCGLPLLGIGVGLSGVVNPYNGTIRYSIPLRIFEPYHLYQELDGAFDVPFLIENDANASAWGELAFHRHRELRDFIYCLVELRDIERNDLVHEKTAVGLGIVIGGSVHYGHRYSAGEFRSLLRKPQGKGQFSIAGDEAFRIEHDKTVMTQFIKELSSHVALFVNTFNLSHVFLGGNIDFESHDVRTVLHREIQENWPYPDPVDCTIAFSSLRERAVAYGAAGMVLERMFADVELVRAVTHKSRWTSNLLAGWAFTDGSLGNLASPGRSGGNLS